MITIFCRMQCSTPPSPPSPSLLYPSYRAPPPGALASKTTLHIVTYFLFNNYNQQQFLGSTAMSSFSPSAPSAAYSHMHMSQVRFTTLLYARAVHLTCIVEYVIQLETPTYRCPRLEFQLFMQMRSAHGTKARCAQCPS